MSIADVLRKYQGERTQTEYAELLGISQGYLSLVLSGGRNAGIEVQRGFLRAFPDAAMEYLTALAAPARETATVAR